jgi:NAD(P)-dependent dehydrogenase (short-subunit alcohol dehydrogenase family)
MVAKKTVLITGASSGIGQAATAQFAEQGWNVVATMRDPGKAAGEGRDDVLLTRLNVRDRASIDAAVAAGIARFGRIDALVNNAGFSLFGVFEGVAREKIQEQFDVNVFGVMDVTRAVLPHFRQNKGGTIVNVSSGAGMFTLPMISLYCASKFALEGFSESLSYELASQNIAVKLVVPHGGVSHTSFPQRVAQESIANSPIADYDAFIANANAKFAEMMAARMMSSADVARVIYEAATDGTDRLRYLVGDDARGFVKARRELPEQDYVAFMRARFRPQM